MFGVTDEALTIAATLSYRSPFLAPIAQRDLANQCKMNFALSQSDHLTALHAYAVTDKMGHERYDFCRANFISIKTMQTIAGLKRQVRFGGQFHSLCFRTESLTPAANDRPSLSRRSCSSTSALQASSGRGSGPGRWRCSGGG